MDRLQVIAALQKWIETRRQEVAFLKTHADLLSERRSLEASVTSARQALTAAMSQMAHATKADNKRFRIVIPEDRVLIEWQEGASDVVCSQIDITFPAKPPA